MSLKVRDLVGFLAPNHLGANGALRCPFWPADVFAIACSVLDRLGVVSGIGTRFMQYNQLQQRERQDRLAKMAREWRIQAGKVSKLKKKLDRVPTSEVQKLWASAFSKQLLSHEFADWQPNSTSAGLSSEEFERSCESLVDLCALADEVFAGRGIINFAKETRRLDVKNIADLAELDFHVQVDELLSSTLRSRKFGSNLCLELCDQRLRVLPKAQPPVNGLSIRSLTSYIALCPSNNLRTSWNRWHRGNVGYGTNDYICNLLLIPWPFDVQPSQFRECQVGGSHERTGWFEYTPDESENGPLHAVEHLVKKAEASVGKPDMVVMPETSMTMVQHEVVKRFLARRGIGLIAGVLSPSAAHTPFGKNIAMMSFPEPEEIDFPTGIEQHKHHRWKIDASQIENYGIATQLNPQKNWWEGIHVEERSLNFLVLRDWLCSCVMICEDLARIDPAGQLVRAVAPDLVIALLFDGPQLSTRWPAYHATVLADDPGCSVLTLSCLGMTKLSRPVNFQNSKDSSTVIGMWRDPRRGQVQIELPPGKTAAMLTISRYRQTFETADGRTNVSLDGVPKFASVNYI